VVDMSIKLRSRDIYPWSGLLMAYLHSSPGRAGYGMTLDGRRPPCDVFMLESELGA